MESEYLHVFRNTSVEKLVLEAYDSLVTQWSVQYEDLFISTRLGITHIIVSGPKNAPPLMLIHAFYASAASWFQNVQTLSETYRVYAVDMIGDPNKSRPIKPIRQLSNFIDWFNDLLDQLHLDKADFVGNSVGAFHVANFALNMPNRVRRMVLIGPAATLLKISKFYLHTFPGGMTGWTPLVRHAVKWIENGSPLDPKFHRLFYLLLKYGKSANQVFPVVFNDVELKRILTPTLLIFGEKEVIYDYNMAIQRAQQNLKNLKSVIIPGANHITATSRSQETNKAIMEFLDSTS
jgi:pimeloyl-ACP methyl ester carboxylesterase